MPKTQHALTAAHIAALLAFSLPAHSQPVQEIIITAVRDSSVIRTEETLVAPADPAMLLRSMPGASSNKNGELTGIAQYRGMYGDRVNVQINGARISSGGPNAMDAALHYAPVALLESLTLQRGITPVSHAQESIGGHVEAQTFKGDFSTDSSFSPGGRIYLGGQSVNHGRVASGFFTLANNRHLFRASVMREDGSDTRIPRGSIMPSEYERERIDLGYSHQAGPHSLALDLTVNNTGDAGTPALPMDIRSVDSRLLRATYQWQQNGRTLSTEFWFNEVEHWMTNFHLRLPPQAGNAQYRQTFATGDSQGFVLRLEQQFENAILKTGLDGHYSVHNADIGNPFAPTFLIENFNDARRHITGVFVEGDFQLGSAIGLAAGIRLNHVRMDSAPVTSNLNPMNLGSGMPVMMDMQASLISTAFNNINLNRTDNNVDMFARLNLDTGTDLLWYAGIARKTRSPSYQERYLWLPMESTAGLADGLTYTGNPALAPETALELELGLDWNNSRLELYPRLFYKKVHDYIQGIPDINPATTQFAMMMANMGMGTGSPLAFANVDATLYGFDLEARVGLGRTLDLRTVLSVVRGSRDDIEDNLYRLAPDRLMLALDHHGKQWTSTLEAGVYREQNRISSTNNELPSGGYVITNFATRTQLSSGLELGFGVENIFDRNYRDHLAGYNRAFNPDLARGERLPGPGRNIYGRVIWHY